MRVLVTSVGRSLESPFSFSFGRSRYFLLVDIEKMEVVEVIENRGWDLTRGCGIFAANLVKGKAKIIITGNIGRMAYEILRKYRHEVYSVVARTVKEAVILLKEGKAIPIVGPRRHRWRRGFS